MKALATQYPSLRYYPTMYKRIATAGGIGACKRDLAIAHTAFCAGARGGLLPLALEFRS